MSVFKPKDSSFWFADYADEAGDRVRVSTKKKTRKEALAVEAELRNKAERVRLGLEIRDRNPSRFTLAEAATWWLKNIAKDHSEPEKVGYVVNAHIVNGKLADERLDQLTPAMLNAWLKAKSKEVSASSANKLRAYVSGIYTQLIREELFVGANPARLSTKLATTRRRKRTLPATYMQLLMTHAPTPGWLVAFTVAGYTGMRRGEIARAFAPTWPGVDLQGRIISVTETKTDEDRVVPIHDVLYDVLKFARRHRVEMPTEGAYEGSHKRVREALRRGGIEDEAELARATFHGLRGLWASQMVASGASRDVTLFIGGWSMGTVADMHYLKYSDDVLRREMDKLTYPIAPEPDGDGPDVTTAVNARSNRARGATYPLKPESEGDGR